MISWSLTLGKDKSFQWVFASKCSPLNNGSTLVHSLSNTPTVELSSFQSNDQDVLKISWLW